MRYPLLPEFDERKLTLELGVHREAAPEHIKLARWRSTG